MSSAFAQNVDFSKGKWVDLSHVLKPGMPHYPGDEDFSYKDVFKGPMENGEYIAIGQFTTNEHLGTHLDAPSHFLQGAPSTDQIKLEQLTGFAAVIDVSEKAKNPRYQITKEDVLAWEKKNHTTVNQKIILFYTGYSQYWGNNRLYFGTEDQSASGVSAMNFPSMGIEMIEWLLKNRQIKAIGIDTASTDLPNIPTPHQSLHPVHQALAKANIPSFENVANLHKIEPYPNGIYVIALPLKIENGTGGPIRMVAFIPDSSSKK
jgi:kynurenine formamidase